MLRIRHWYADQVEFAQIFFSWGSIEHQVYLQQRASHIDVSLSVANQCIPQRRLVPQALLQLVDR